MSTHALHASQVVGNIVGKWRGAPKVTVVSWPKDLPSKNVPADARGMFKNGETWIVANTQSTSKVGETLAHEAIGHHAMREALGSSWRSFMFALNHGARAGDHRLSGVQDYVRDVYVDGQGECNLSADQLGDEVAAAVTEYRFDSNAGRLVVDRPAHKLASATVGHFAREALYIDKPATFEELEGTLLAAEHRLRFGGAFWGIAYQVKRLYASAMSKPWNPRNPPMSLRESSRMLRAAEGRTYDKNRLLAFLFTSGALIGLLVYWLVGMFIVWKVLGWIFRMIW